MMTTNMGRVESAAREAIDASLAPGVVLTCLCEDADNPRNHESMTRRELARRLAALKGYAFGGEYDASQTYPARRYLVPAQTVIGYDRDQALGIQDEDDIFGAVVPHAFMSVKTITHPLVHDGAHAPGAWCHGFCEQVRHAVLEGFAAFHRQDARHAGRTMLEQGPVRVKRATGVGGTGQMVVSDMRELELMLADVDDDEMERFGIVFEENLHDVTTHSVGQVRVDGLVASYCGTQHLTPNNRGVHVYGGSTLTVVRGEFDALLTLPLDDGTRVAIGQARDYDHAAFTHFRGMFASRRNYDIARGSNDRGQARSGVLEQSWRMGGASGAEVAALQAFRDDPSLDVVRATTTEIYGDCEPPAEAIMYFRDVDERVGMLTKFTVLEGHANA